MWDYQQIENVFWTIHVDKSGFVALLIGGEEWLGLAGYQSMPPAKASCLGCAGLWWSPGRAGSRPFLESALFVTISHLISSPDWTTPGKMAYYSFQDLQWHQMPKHSCQYQKHPLLIVHLIFPHPSLQFQPRRRVNLQGRAELYRKHMQVPRLGYTSSWKA